MLSLLRVVNQPSGAFRAQSSAAGMRRRLSKMPVENCTFHEAVAKLLKGFPPKVSGLKGR